MHLDQRQDRVLNTVKLHQRHATIVGKELKLGHLLARFLQKRLAQIILRHGRWNVRYVQRLRGWVDVVEILRARSLEAMQRRVGVVLGEARVLGWNKIQRLEKVL